MIAPIAFLREFNRAHARKKYKIKVASTRHVLQILKSLAELDFLRFSKSPQNRFTSIWLIGNRSKRVLKGLKTISTPAHPVYKSFRDLKKDSLQGRHYILSNDKGIYATISTHFDDKGLGGICLFELSFNKKN